eukprot:scaffold1051_cov119-Cylindrotheca_fusiformis.AAC.24
MSTMNYYDILGVDPSVDQAAIRKAYLKLSLKHHPDKNPDNVEEAKAKFIVIGTAYETLSDPSKRAAYDREIRRGGARAGMPNFSSAAAGAAGAGGASFSDSAKEQAYDKFSDFFDATVAGMSEAELAAAMAGATMIGSIVGSMMGSRLGGKRGAGGGSRLLGSAGSVVGSMVASEMAATSVKALHQKSIQRIQYKEECKRAVQRGEPMPDPPARSQWDEILEKTMATVKGVANSTMKKGGGGNNSSNNTTNGQQGNNGSSENGSNNGGSLANSLFKAAAAMAKANMEAKMGGPNTANTHR